jgi:hypothetical protein
MTVRFALLVRDLRRRPTEPINMAFGSGGDAMTQLGVLEP